MPALVALLLGAVAGAAQHDPIAAAQTRFEQLGGYQAVLTSTGADGETERIRYYYKAPGYVRMEFLQPHRGALLLFDPHQHKVRVWPFGGSGPSVALNPGNRLIRSAGGHRVDRSDVGALLANVRRLQADGTTRQLGLECSDRCLLHLQVIGGPGRTEDGVHRYALWLDPDLLFPVRVEGYDLKGRPRETVALSEIVLDPPFGTELFRRP